MDLVQKALKDGRLPIDEKPKASIQVDTEPLHVGNTNFIEHLEILVVEATEGLEATNDHEMNMEIGEQEE